MRRDAIDALNKGDARCSKIRNTNSLRFSSWEATKRTLYSKFAVLVVAESFGVLGALAVFLFFLMI